MSSDIILQERKIIKNERRCLIHPYIFSQRSKDVGTGLCILTITFIFPCLCTFWYAIPTYETDENYYTHTVCVGLHM